MYLRDMSVRSKYALLLRVEENDKVDKVSISPGSILIDGRSFDNSFDVNNYLMDLDADRGSPVCLCGGRLKIAEHIGDDSFKYFKCDNESCEHLEY